LFEFSLGSLKYRAQRRVHSFFPDRDFVLPCGQVNNPDPERGGHIRTLEWKHMMEPGTSGGAVGTVVTTETPYASTDPRANEYPSPDERNQSLYEAYAKLAAQCPGLLVCGRLGEYRYYDMDQAIGRAMKIARNILCGAR
jgi:UDP-galactopyranose mutase